jgi:hypothetical protein
MNMISTGAFQNEMDASNKQSTLAKKFAAVWEKKNAKAARAGGVSLMALSLAACGSDDATTTTSSTTATTTTTTTTTVVTPVSVALTIGSDAVSGTAGADTFSGARVDTMQTWNSADTLSGGDGVDTFTAVIHSAVTPAAGAVTGIENLQISSITANNTVTFSTASVTGISGVTHITNVGSTKDLDLVRVTEIAEVTINNVIAGEDTRITFADTAVAGTSDTLTLNVNGANGTINIGAVTGEAGAGFESLVINSTGSSSTFSAANLDAAAATVTVKGTAALDMNAAAVFPKMSTFDGSAASGDIDLLLGADTVTGTTDAKTLTFGSGADDLDVGNLGPAEIGVLTIDMGKGNDSVDLDDFADATMVVAGGEGTDELETSAAIAAANGTTITGFETFKYGENTGTQSMSAISANPGFTKIIANAATVTVTNMSSSVDTVELVGGVATAAGAFTRLIDSTTNSITVKATTADLAYTGVLNLKDEETITFDSSAFNISLPFDITTTDATSIVLTGSNVITLGANGAREFLGTKLATLDASGVTGTEAVSVFAINNTVAMTVTGPASTGTFIFDGGSGADTVTAGGGILDIDAGLGDDIITGGAKADILQGDGGSDTITGGEAADYIDGGAGVDTISLTETTAASDEVELAQGAANYDVITGFLAGAGTGADNISALDATFAWKSTDGTSTVALQTGATMKAADAAGDSTIHTISTNVAANTFDNFVAGLITEADMEAAVISGLGLTGALDTAANILVFIDDGEDTGVFIFDGADAAIDDVAVAAEIEIMAILDGLADATTIVAGDVLIA